MEFRELAQKMSGVTAGEGECCGKFGVLEGVLARVLQPWSVQGQAPRSTLGCAYNSQPLLLFFNTPGVLLTILGSLT